tara:strand:- start:662 stop:1336 length:675 start_codon:yes stop_codon:yes gene_type:complete
MNNKDIAALESIEKLANYNSYIFSKIFKKKLNGHVLDFGCGFGTFSIFIKEKFNKNVIGYEINEQAKDILDTKNVEHIDSLDKYKESFDTVVSLNVLEHIENDTEQIEYLYNLLADEGKLILYLPHSMKIWSRLDEDVNHFRRYTKKDLVKKLKDNKFSIISSEYVDFIGWATLLISKIFKIELKFDEKKLLFYDKYIFFLFKYFDILFSRITGKNILIVAQKK